MPTLLKLAIIAAHLLVYLVAAVNIWIFSYWSQFYTSVVKVRSLPLIYCGYACFAIANSYEIAEHMGDDWIYVSQVSDLNRLFYTFITAGMCLIALGLKKSRFLDLILVASMVAVPLLYGVQEGKELMQLVQLVPSIIFVYNWYVVMRDWRVFLFPLFANLIAVGFGIALIVTGQQALHLFVGSASAIGLLILGRVAWVKPKRHSKR